MREDPSQALQEYTVATNGILDFLTAQLSSVGLWKNVTGTLVKVSSSSSGFVWGVNAGGEVYVRQEPGTDAGWNRVDKSFEGTVLDLATDPSSVYILFRTSGGETRLVTHPVDGSGSWGSPERVPFGADRLVVTNGFVTASGNGSVGTCAKPCNTGNWNVREDTHRLLGAGGGDLYAVVPGVQGVFKTDETAQTGWAPVPGLEGKQVSTLGAEADNSVLYAADSNHMYRCDDACKTKAGLQQVDTQGYVPLQNKGSIAVNPTTRNVWMAAQESDVKGNLFTRLDTDGSTPVLDFMDQTDRRRDRIMNSLGDAVEVQTAKLASEMSRQEAAAAIQESLDLSGQRERVNNEIQILKRKIESEKGASSGLTQKLPALQILIVALAAVVLIYVVAGWFLPSMITMGLSAVILAVGLGMAIYFSTTR